MGGRYFTCKQNHTPFDVVAWHGKYVQLNPPHGPALIAHRRYRSLSYVPYKYDLDAFIVVGSLNKDHMDPSIFTILTARSKTPGVALCDVAMIKDRWDVANHTFRPPVRRSAYLDVRYGISDGARILLCSISIGTRAWRSRESFGGGIVVGASDSLWVV